MDNGVIAIKTADGSRFPILDRTDRGRKRVVLTTSRDNQERVQIDMYQGDRDDLANAEYVGSLVIDDIDPASAGSVEISLIVGIDERGQLQARAQNLSNGDTQSLSINLDQSEFGDEGISDEGEPEELPDFSLDDEETFDLAAELEEPPVFDPDESTDESGFDGPDLDDLAFELPEEESASPADTGYEEGGESEDFSFDEFDTPYADGPVSADESVAGDEPVALDEPDVSETAPASDVDEEWDSVEESDSDVATAGPSPVFFVAYMLLGLAILAGLIYLIYGAFQAEPVPPLESSVGVGLASLPVPLIGGRCAARRLPSRLRRIGRLLRGRRAGG